MLTKKFKKFDSDTTTLQLEDDSLVEISFQATKQYFHGKGLFVQNDEADEALKNYTILNRRRRRKVAFTSDTKSE